MFVILSSSYMSWPPSVLLRLITIIYEIGIILVNAQHIIDIPPISLSVNDQIFEFVRFGHKSISNILNRLSTDLKQNYFKDARSPPYYDIRYRHLNIVHIGIRNTCSALHNALIHANLIPNPSCSCWYSTENAEQLIVFLLEMFAQRNILLQFRWGPEWLSELVSWIT
jgi:hypothetical protein